MNYEINGNSVLVLEPNVRPHLDIERGIQERKNGLFTFNVRINQGEIVDYATFETITIRDYEGVMYTGFKERGFTYDSGNRSPENAVRPDKR